MEAVLMLQCVCIPPPQTQQHASESLTLMVTEGGGESNYPACQLNG